MPSRVRISSRSAGWWRCRRPPGPRNPAQSRAGRSRPRRRVLPAARSMRDGEVEGAALPDFALHPDPAAHQLDQLRGDRQAQAGAAVAARGRAVGLRERVEDEPAACPRECRCPCRGRRSADVTLVGRSADSLDAARPLRPRSVNLMALPTRLTRICRSRPGSPDEHRRARRARCGRPAPAPSRAPAAPAVFIVSPRLSRRSKSIGSSSSLPASILEKSRMSLMIASSDSAERLDRAQVLALLGA